MQGKNFISVKEVAEELGVSKSYACDLLGKRAAGKVLKRIYPPLGRGCRC